MKTLSGLLYKNEFTDSFPGDDSGSLFPRQTPHVAWASVNPTPVKAPVLLAWSNDLAATLGLQKPATQQDINILAGNAVMPAMRPYAACYAGHQFGSWAGQLGDGRAITLAEMPVGDATFELQLKGAGPTPYSRRADGRAVVRSSVREYLMSEAMHHLGVPTTRALALTATGDKVLRDMFYDGNPAREPGAVVARVAPSFLRFGSFEMPASRGEKALLQQLADWTISRYYPHLSGKDKILQWFAEITDRTAFLMSEWMRTGFVHGVMNTDNMSILGLTIDYGPYSFVDDYDPLFTPNTTDLPGRRYAFSRQPSVGHWNLSCLAGALSPLLPETEPLQKILDGYPGLFAKHYRAALAAKLSLDAPREADTALFESLEHTLAATRADMTIFFQEAMLLPEVGVSKDEAIRHFAPSFYHQPDEKAAAQLYTFVHQLQARRASNTIPAGAAHDRARAANPRFILRNYMLHQAIQELESGGDAQFRKLEALLLKPYSNDGDEFYARRPDWAATQPGCSMLSCSS